ncbi:ABC transporter permease [Candidatus Cyanaurora vandensis]|uniref:ABC transporter permease n=1 Tax=Candidatus Cyanaurora vandensis TaxID=2714958 RepID=UPI00257E0A9C|nr:ABC transporter permease [Candidatus Cyanaurora vandensis]
MLDLVESALFINLATLTILLLFGWAVWSLSRQEFIQEAWRRLQQNTVAMVCLGVIGVYVAISLADSLVVPLKEGVAVRNYSLVDLLYKNVPQEEGYSAPFAKTTYKTLNAKPLKGFHPLGTNVLGEDVLRETLKASRTAIIVGGVTCLIAIPIGLTLGILAGFYGGWVDDTVQYTYSVVYSIPEILLFLALFLVLGQGLPQLCLALGVATWVNLCRQIRAETIKHRERDYVLAARALGVSDFQTLLRHILPNVMHIVVIICTLRFSALVLSESILSYIGIGVGAETSSWGFMINGARQELAREPSVWWVLVAATGALFGLVLAFNILGDAVRDALDPKLRTR